MSYTFGFVDDVMFSHNSANTDCQIQATGELYTVTRQVAPGAKSALDDCLVK